MSRQDAVSVVQVPLSMRVPLSVRVGADARPSVGNLDLRVRADQRFAAVLARAAEFERMAVNG